MKKRIISISATVTLAAICVAGLAFCMPSRWTKLIIYEHGLDLRFISMPVALSLIGYLARERTRKRIVAAASCRLLAGDTISDADRMRSVLEALMDTDKIAAANTVKHAMQLLLLIPDFDLPRQYKCDWLSNVLLISVDPMWGEADPDLAIATMDIMENMRASEETYYVSWALRLARHNPNCKGVQARCEQCLSRLNAYAKDSELLRPGAVNPQKGAQLLRPTLPHATGDEEDLLRAIERK